MKKTVLFNEHINLNAKMVDFGGFNMPIQYQGISVEHINVFNRNSLILNWHIKSSKINHFCIKINVLIKKNSFFHKYLCNLKSIF